MLQNLINHIVFVVDQSLSMQDIASEVVKVFDAQVENLAIRSKEMDQETRASVYLFSDNAECVVYDTDVLRLPKLSGVYRPNGWTALIDGTMLAIEELEQTATLHGDHAFLIFVLTDGQENRSKTRSEALREKLNRLPNNWTVAAMVPDQMGVHECKKYGFFAENVQVWSTTGAGVREVGEVMRKATDNFMRGRKAGIRGSNNLFQLDVSALTKIAVRSNLEKLSPREYELFVVHRESEIRPFVERITDRDYRIGSAYYELAKREAVQSRKQICIMEKSTGNVWTGANARTMLGLPDYEVKVSPEEHERFTVFIQSTSVNRKLPKDTSIIVLK